MIMTPTNDKWWVYSFEKDEDVGTLNSILIIVIHNTKRPWIEDDHVIEKNDKRVRNEFVHLENDNKGNELGFVLVFAILYLFFKAHALSSTKKKREQGDIIRAMSLNTK